MGPRASGFFAGLHRLGPMASGCFLLVYIDWGPGLVVVFCWFT